MKPVPAQEALVQITLALHRAVCRELSEHYRDRLLRVHYNGSSARGRARTGRAARARAYQWPTAARLREFWRAPAC